MADNMGFDPSGNAASTAGWGGLAGGSNAVNGGQVSGSTPGVGGVPGVSVNNWGAGSNTPTAQGVTGTATPVIGTNPSLAGSATNSWATAPAGVTGTKVPDALGYTSDGSASTDPTIVANRLARQQANQGPAIYGANGDMTLGQFQDWQAQEFNKNQLAAQAQFNAARAGMPYNTTGNLANPYDQYVANPASAGQASAAFQSPENAAAWQNSGLASQVASPTSSLATGNTFASQGGQDYQRNQLAFLLSALQNYGLGGQNRFGNTFSPIFTGTNNLNGLGNSSSNPGGYQANVFSQILPLLIGLAARNNPASGAYGNLGGY